MALASHKHFFIKPRLSQRSDFAMENKLSLTERNADRKTVLKKVAFFG